MAPPPAASRSVSIVPSPPSVRLLFWSSSAAVDPPPPPSGSGASPWRRRPQEPAGARWSRVWHRGGTGLAFGGASPLAAGGGAVIGETLGSFCNIGADAECEGRPPLRFDPTAPRGRPVELSPEGVRWQALTASSNPAAG
ncbi:unnamed protein product [Gadus morhua 'NCC']